MQLISGLAPLVTFAESAVNAAPQLLDADITFTSSTPLDGYSLVVAGLSAEDRVSVLHDGDGAGQIGVAGEAISFEGVVIGIAAGGEGGDFTVTLTANATEAAVDALIQRLAYGTLSDAPAASRTLTLAVTAPGVANPFFGLSTGYASSPVFADWDGDGDLDLVSGERYGSLLAWRNTGSAATPSFTPLTDGTNPFEGIDGGYFSAPAFIDLDGDGDLDLVGGAYGQLLAWRNTGTSTAPSFTALLGGDNPFEGFDLGYRARPSFVDLDGDGDLDLVAGASDGLLRAWLNTGTGTAPIFTPLSGSDDPFASIDVGEESAPAFLDFDGDGDLDLVSGARYGGILAWRNTGTTAAPVFSALTGDANPFAAVNANALSTPTAVDIDADGDLDLVVGGNDGALRLLRTAPVPASITVAITAENDAPVITSAVTADVVEGTTGIAYQAIAVDPDGTTSFTWSLGGADAALFTIDANGAVRFRIAPDFAAPGDAGGDNVHDITIGVSDGTASVTQDVAITVTNFLAGPALSGFRAAASFTEEAVNGGPQLLDTDVTFTAESLLDGGLLEVSGLLAEDRISVLHQGDGAGEIGVSGSTISFGGIAFGTAAGGVGNTFSVTFNADATADAVDALIQRLAYANVSDTPTSTRNLTIDVRDSAGARLGEIGLVTPLASSASPLDGVDVVLYGAPVFVDWDADGDQDLVAGTLDGTLLAWLNTGSSAAPSFTALSGTATPFALVDAGDRSRPAFLDLDGDADLDLVLGGADGTLQAWENTGSSAAPVFSLLGGTANPFGGFGLGSHSAPAAIDFDGDGDDDLVAGERDGRLFTWRNEGAGATPRFSVLSGSASPFHSLDLGIYAAPAFVDLDGDGDLDLVSGESEGLIRAWRNTGTTALPVFVALTGPANPFEGLDAGKGSAPAFLDLDGDGARDLIIGADRAALQAWRISPPTPPPAIAITITAEDDAPRITSTTTARFVETTTGIAYQATGIDPDSTIAWSLGGLDAALFSIDATGAVRFVAAPRVALPGDTGGDNVHDITVQAFDGTTTEMLDVAITVTPLLIGPALAGLTSGFTVAEDVVNAAPRFLDTEVAFTGSTPLAGGLLRVAGLLAEDRVAIAHEGDGAGQIGVAGGVVSFGGVAFGTATGGDGTPLIVSFTAAASAAAVEALIQRLTYANVSETPTTRRDLTINVADAAGNNLVGLGGLTPLTGTADPFAGFDTGTASAPVLLDLDGDGDLDLVSGSGGGTLLAWRNTGTSLAPVFSPLSGSADPFATVIVGNVSAPAFVDFDGDGDRDLVLGAADGQLLAWRNTGSAAAPVFTRLSGTASPFNGIDTGDDSRPAFLDLDSDGDLDLVAGALDGTLRAWRNIGDATLPRFTMLAGAENPFAGIDVGNASSPAFLDFDGDGDLDLVSGESEGTLLAWRNGGGVAAPAFTALAGTDNPFHGIDVGKGSTPGVADLDGDLDLDLVVGEVTGPIFAWRNEAALPTVTVLVTAQNDAPIVTGGPDPSFAENTLGIVYRARASDPEGLTDFDWSLGGSDAALFSIDERGDVRFRAAPDFEAPGDADGDNLYALTIRASDGVSVGTRDIAVTVTNRIEGPALSGLAASVSLTESEANAAPRLLDADVAFTIETALAGGRLVVGGLLAEDRISVLHQGDGAGQIGVADHLISYAGVVFGTAAGGVGGDFSVTFNAAATAEAVDALIQRLAYANASDTPTTTRSLTVNVLDGTGLGMGRDAIGGLTAPVGTFNPFGIIDVGDVSRPIFVDLDGDGDGDLVSGRQDGTLLAWRNTGTAAVPVFSALTGTTNPFDGIDGGTGSAPAFLDLEGDGDLDLILGNADGTLGVWRNTGGTAAPSFTVVGASDNPFQGIDFGNYSQPTMVDLDGDGDLDLVAAWASNAPGSPYAVLRAWRNDNEVAPQRFTALTGTADPFQGIDFGLGISPAFVNFDGDGDMDLVLGGQDGTLMAWRNTGTASAPGFTALTGTANPFDGIDAGERANPTFGHLDRDGDLDLVVGEFFGRLRPWLNTAPLPGITVTVDAQNDAPVITSAATASFVENDRDFVYQASATDADGTTSFTWSLGGTDAALFTIDADGALRFRPTAFISAPDFERPGDAGGDNIHDLILTASDGTTSTSQALTITVTNEEEPPTLLTNDPARVAENSTFVDYLRYANDPEGVALVWSLAAVGDHALFSIDAATGALHFRDLPDFETPADADGDNRYELQIVVNDGANWILPVTVEVTDLTSPLLLEGTAAADTLRGETGADTLKGGLGADILIGQEGDDTYWVDDPGDETRESVGGGHDRVIATLHWVLGDEVERLSLLGRADLNGTGNALANRIDGNPGANTLSGGEGSDSLYGGDGRDTLLGGAGADRLDGGTEADSLVGGAGDDTYIVDAAGDAVLELAGGGYDRIAATLDWTLGEEVERLSLLGSADLNGTGNALANRIDGNAGANSLAGAVGDDTLFGGAGRDTLLGGEGADRLDGGTEADSLVGGAGDDTYIVDAAGDAVLELAGGGHDRVAATLDWTLGEEVERLSLLGSAGLNGTGNALANRIDGNAGANILSGGEGSDSLYGGEGRDTLLGGEGADRLDGGTEADSLVGGAGDDTYIVDAAGDAVLELAGGGHDWVAASLDWTLGEEVERLSLRGSAGLNGTGNALANRIDGNAGANILSGGEGSDSLYGGAGQDTVLGGAGADLLDGGAGADSLVGGDAADVFLLRSAAEANGDVIADFSVAQGDRLDLRSIDANALVLGNQAFSWIGASAFGGQAGQLRYENEMLEGDLDGDGGADFRLGLEALGSLSPSSIWL